MKAPRGGLRPLHNKRADVSKVELRVPAGGTVHVQDDVAEQLLGTGDFAEGVAPAGVLDAIDANHARRFPDAKPEGDAPTGDAEFSEPVKPKAKAAKKAGK